MKIAIITFSDFNTNYGSRLQAYSLRRFLVNEGHDVEFIRYREFNKPPKIKTFKILASVLINKLIRTLDKKNRLIRNQNFENFSTKFLKHTKLYTSNGELSESLPIYDCYICGSDQIWNLECLGGLRTPYFLKFAPENKLKIAYAPSFGDYIINSESEDEIIKLIKKFDFISVREESGVKMLKNYIDKDIEHVLDPAFLTSKEEWETILPDLNENEEYGICYLVRRSRECTKIINLINKNLKTKIYNLSDNSINIKGTSKKYITAGPLEFLSLLRGSKFAIGTSFHLAVFSIIFKKPFIIIGMKSNEARLKSLLKKLGCEERLIIPEDITEEEISKIIQKIDFKDVEVNLKKEINNSKNYLLRAIDKNNILNEKEKKCESIIL